MSDGIYGVLAEFPGPDELVHGAEELRQAGYRRVESYSPFAVEGIDHALHFRPLAVPAIFLICGLLGAAGGYLGFVGGLPTSRGFKVQSPRSRRR